MTSIEDSYLKKYNYVVTYGDINCEPCYKSICLALDTVDSKKILAVVTASLEESPHIKSLVKKLSCKTKSVVFLKNNYSKNTHGPLLYKLIKNKNNVTFKNILYD